MCKGAMWLGLLLLLLSFSLQAQTEQAQPMQSMQAARAQLDVPSSLTWRKEAAGTLWGEIPGSTDLVVTVVVHSAERDGQLVDGVGPKVAEAQAKASGAPRKSRGSLVWYEQVGGPPKGAKQGSFVYDFYYGIGAHAVTISCVIDIHSIDSKQVQAVLASVPLIMESVRSAK